MKREKSRGIANLFLNPIVLLKIKKGGYRELQALIEKFRAGSEPGHEEIRILMEKYRACSLH
jgi:hypothetical protein